MKIKKKSNKKLPHLEEDAFIREINEDLKNDNMRLIWKKYGVYIVSAVAIILTITVSFETIKAWRMRQFEAWSNSYAFALALEKDGNFDESLTVLREIQSSRSGIYADLALIQEVSVLFGQGKSDEALALLEKIISDKKINKKLLDAAVMKLVSYKIDFAPAEELKALLLPLTDEKNSWSLEAKELLALLFVREGDLEQARGIYDEIIETAGTNENLKSRVKDMLAALEQLDSKN